MGNDLASVLIIGLALTLVAYGAFPLLFALLQKGTTTAKEYRTICFVVNLLIMFVFIVINSSANAGAAGSAAPYFIWTSVFTGIGTGILKKRKIIPTEEVSSQNTPEVKPNLKKFKCSECQSVFTGGNNVCPNCKAVGTIKRGTEEEIRLWNSSVEAPGAKAKVDAPAQKAAVPVQAPQTELSEDEDITVCHKCGMLVPSSFEICPRCGTGIVHF